MASITEVIAAPAESPVTYAFVAPYCFIAYSVMLAIDFASAGRAPEAAPASFRDLLGLRSVWALFFTALAGNITMYGWLNWLPSYLMIG